MKYKVMSASLVIGILTSVHAYAQSSVMLYGLIDEGIIYNSNAKGGRQYALNAANLQGDRWGLRGSEDVGGGLKTIFVLESGFNINSGALGQGGAAFGRQAYVGLTSASLGSVTFGRQYDPIVYAVSGVMLANSLPRGGIGPQLGGVAGQHPGDLDALGNTYHANNSIEYVSNTYGGFQAIGLYSLGGVAGNVSKNQIWSLGMTYKVGSLYAGAVFEKINDPNFSYYGGNPSGSSTGNNITNPVFSGYASAGAQEIASAGATYAIGRATFGVVYSNVRFSHLGTEGGVGLNPRNLSGTAAFNVAELNASFNFTPAWIVGVGCTYTAGASVDGASGVRYRQVNIGSDYALSKRTDFYVVLNYERASGIDSTGKPAVAALDGLTASSSNSQTGLAIGIRTLF